MKKIILATLCAIITLTSFSQTEEEKRAIIAAKNKIQSDSVSLHSRSMRVQECKKQNEVLLDAIENAYLTIKLQTELSEIKQTDLDLCRDSLAATHTQLQEVTEKAEKEEKGKRTWRGIGLGAIGVVILETAILILL